MEIKHSAFQPFLNSTVSVVGIFKNFDWIDVHGTGNKRIVAIVEDLVVNDIVHEDHCWIQYAEEIYKLGPSKNDKLKFSANVVARKRRDRGLHTSVVVEYSLSYPTAVALINPPSAFRPITTRSPIVQTQQIPDPVTPVASIPPTLPVELPTISKTSTISTEQLLGCKQLVKQLGSVGALETFLDSLQNQFGEIAHAKQALLIFQDLQA